MTMFSAHLLLLVYSGSEYIITDGAGSLLEGAGRAQIMASSEHGNKWGREAVTLRCQVGLFVGYCTNCMPESVCQGLVF